MPDGTGAVMRACPLAMLSVLTLAACTDDPAPSEPRADAPADAAVEPEATEEAPEPVYIFDAQGALLPSDEYVAGVRLPRGLELFRREGVVHTYRTRAPIQKVLSYFGPMLITGRVERQGKGAVYRRASVRGAEISPTKVDVSILDIGSGYTRVSITELPPPPAHPPSQDEVLNAARREFERLD